MKDEWVIGLLIGGWGVSLVGGVVVAWVWRRRWVVPVRELMRQTGEVARVRVGGAREVRELGERINALGGKARRQLAEVEEQWRVVQALVDTLPDPVMLVEGHRRVRLINAAAGRLVGVSPSRAIGRWLGEVVTDRGLLETFEAVPAVVEGQAAGMPVEREVRVEREGSRLTYQAVAVRTADGVLLVLRDVTALSETLRMKTDFVANASHELRTPVAAIKVAFETMREVWGEDPEQAQRCAGMIGGHLKRLEELLRDLLDLSRLENPELVVEWGEVRSADLFERVRGALGELAMSRGVELRMEGEETFVGDGRLLDLVLKNLAENAIKFTPSGGRVVVGIGRVGECVSAWVKDTGVGIPAEHVGRVFERFYQVDPARSGGGGRGTGLGLAIVKHAVGAMGGTVSVESEVGVGTCVTCVLPGKEGTSNVQR